MKRLLSAFALAVTVILGAAAQSAPQSGSLSKTISWALADSVLTISGTGKMPGYNSTSISKLPWQDERFAAQVKKIVVEEGITEVGAYCFGSRAHSRNARSAKNHTFYNTQDASTTELFLNIDEVTLPSTLLKIGAHAFVRMPITHIHLPRALEEISSGAFANTALHVVVIPENVRRIGPEAFSGCLNLRAIDFSHLPLKLSAGLLFGAERLRMILHTSGIKSVEPSTFNATFLTEYNEQAILDMFHSDGLRAHMDMYMPKRELFTGTDDEYEQAANRTADRFYEREASNATSMFDLDRLRLLPYNAETATLTVSSVNHGLLLMSLPPEQAEQVTARWDEVRATAQPVYRPDNGRVRLQSVNFFLDDTVIAAAVLPNP